MGLKKSTMRAAAITDKKAANPCENPLLCGIQITPFGSILIKNHNKPYCQHELEGFNDGGARGLMVLNVSGRPHESTAKKIFPSAPLEELPLENGILVKAFVAMFLFM